MKNLFKVLLMAFILYGCSPEKRLQRLMAAHPELEKHDTSRVVKSDSTKAIDVLVKAKIPVKNNTEAINKALDNTRKQLLAQTNKNSKDSKSWAKKVDSLIMALKKQIKPLIVNKPILTDTVCRIEGDITVKVFQKGNFIDISIKRPLSVKTFTVTQIANVIECPPCKKSGWLSFCEGHTIISWLVLLIAIALWIYKPKK